MHSSSIEEIVKESANLEKRKKELNSELKTIRSRLNILKEEIIKFLDENDETGLNFKGVYFVKNDKKRVKRVKKEEKNSKIIEVLRQAGIKKPEDVLKQIENAGKGPQETTSNLSIKNLEILDAMHL